MDDLLLPPSMEDEDESLAECLFLDDFARAVMAVLFSKHYWLGELEEDENGEEQRTMQLFSATQIETDERHSFDFIQPSIDNDRIFRGIVLFCFVLFSYRHCR